MSRNHRPGEIARMAKAKRDKALERGELRGPSEPRTPAAGPTSFALKAEDPTIRKMIDEALARSGM